MAQITFSEHPDYKRLSPKWIKWRDLYEGDHDVLRSSRYLWMHELENEKSVLGESAGKLRQIRENRSRYLNLTEPVVSRWLSFLFRKPPNVPDSVKALFDDDEYYDVTGSGVGFESFIRDHIGRNYILYGRPMVFVDTASVYAPTLAQARALGSRPFMELLDPLEVRDWQISSDGARVGKYDFLRTEYELLEPRTNAGQAPEVRCYSKVLQIEGGKYQIATYKAREPNKDGSRPSKIDWQPVGDPLDIVGWDEIPVSSLFGDSFIKDAAEQQLALFNLMSAESSVLNSQAFQRIFITGVTNEQAKMVIGEYLINFLPESAGVQSIDPVSTEAIRGAVTNTIDQLFKVAFNQLNGLAGDSKESPGAETRREMREEFIAMVSTSLGEVEDIINETIEYWAKFKNKTVTERVTLDKNITAEDVDKEISLWQAHADSFKQLPTFYKEVMKKHTKFFNLAKQPDIEKEIDASNLGANEPQAGSQDILRGIVNGQGSEQPQTAA